MSGDGHRNCSLFYQTLKDGTCHSHWQFNIQSDLMVNNNTLDCKDGNFISQELKDDFVIDCGHIPEDEPEMLTLLEYGGNSTCPNNGQLQCRKGHSRCYNISDICVYRLNEFQVITPCRTGEHIQSCKMFECNMKFKCPESYCIPWNYLCDGKWDCPQGFDESNIHYCGVIRRCVNMFKCTNSQVCVHLGDVCNYDLDCPNGDDEFLCSLKETRCPQSCECLTLIVTVLNDCFYTQDIWDFYQRLSHLMEPLTSSVFNIRAGRNVLTHL